jgi:hypothetical protein
LAACEKQLPKFIRQGNKKFYFILGQRICAKTGFSIVAVIKAKY